MLLSELRAPDGLEFPGSYTRRDGRLLARVEILVISLDKEMGFSCGA